MKKYTLGLLVLLGCSEVETPAPVAREVNFSGIEVQDFQLGGANSRVMAEDWKHIFERYAELEITNVASGQTYTLPFDPNDFQHPYNINLPEGEYTATTAQAGEGIIPNLPFTAEESFIVGEERLNLTLNAETSYGLVTVKNEFLESAALVVGGERYELVRTLDRENYFLYAPGGTTAELQIIDHFDQDTVRRDLTIGAREHYHFFLFIPENGRVGGVELGMMNEK
ncbi:hypothetical protein KI659_14725 [Litoribacter alkaliphilus]|uniref:Uncharacterized protein n=1 Tax=Litoribacter ruber TaxID=702568 RepID=A0AAP2CMH0_9BACT|nr:hypothetical protein [Litoribacter alkaliphilus]MBS9525270.1 hypothetical protein [Litoribacter alkaliphilus]